MRISQISQNNAWAWQNNSITGLGGASQTQQASQSWMDQLSQLSSKNSKSIDRSFTGFVTNLKSSAAGLKSAISELRSSQSVMGQKTITTSDSAKMTVSQTGRTPPASSVTPRSVRIEQIAAGQTNTGSAMTSSAQVDSANVGVKNIEITSGGKTSTISFEVKEGDTNKDMQDKMAAAINKANIGVKASVSADSTTSTLKIESTGTGTAAGAFSMKDLIASGESASGGAVAMTGTDNVERSAQNAIYYVNGWSQARTSATNTVDLGSGMTATLKQASSDEIKINMSANTSGAVNLANKLADSYNGLFKTARDSGGMGNDRLATRMISTSRTYSGSLSSIGISFNSSGEMTVDEDKVKKAAENGSFERFLSDGSSGSFGYLNQLSRTADDVSNNTARYTNSSALSSGTYNNMFGNMASNSQFNAIGLLFSFMA